MNARFVVAQAGSSSAAGGSRANPRIVRVIKPGAEEAVTIELGYEQHAKLDLSGVAGEKLVLVHIGEKLIILFDNKSTVTVHPFFDSMGVPLQNITVEAQPGEILPSGDFASTVPISTDQSILPTAGPGNAGTQPSGANFAPYKVDPLATPDPLPLLPPEQLPPIQFTQNRLVPTAGEEPSPPTNGFPSIGPNALAQLDDDALAGGIAGGVGDDPDSVNTTGILAHNFGPDGAGTTLLTAAGAVLPADFTASVNAAGTILTIHQVSTNLNVLQVALSNATDGSYTITQLNAIKHPAGGDENNLQFAVNYVVTDSNGDVVVGSLSINVDDDTPTISAPGASATLTVDETVLATDATANFANAFTSATGADSGGTISYLLGVVAGPSGLVDTATKEAVNLVLNGTVVEGRTATTNLLVFTVTADGSGNVTLDQVRAVVHPTSDPNEPTTLSADDLVTLTATITDGDGDTASAVLNIGQNLVFRDDGPSIDINLVANAAIRLDESLGTTGSVQNEGGAVNNDETGSADPTDIAFATIAAASLFSETANAGADGTASKIYTLLLNSTASGLTDAETNEAITLSANASNTLITGKTVIGGLTVFTIAVAADGAVTVQQFRALEHNDPLDHDENTSPEAMAAGIVELQVVLTDGDGDTATDKVELGSLIKFEDDGPAIDIDVVPQPVLTIQMDESIVNPRTTSDESGTIAAGTDDTGLTAPDGVNPFGSKATAAGQIAALFTNTVADGGTDGQKSLTSSYELTLTNAAGTVVGTATAPADFTLANAAFKGVATTLNVTDATNSTTTDTLYLFKISNTVIEARVDLNNDGVFGSNEVALRYTLTGPLTDPVVTVDQILALDHPTTTGHDEPVTMAIAGAPVASAGIGVTKTSVLTDGDDDTATDSATLNITGALTIEDDGPIAIASPATNGGVTFDETPGLQNATATPTPAGDANDNDVAGATIAYGAKTVASLFAPIVLKGNDPHTAVKDSGAIGFAASLASLVVLSGDFGTDGAKSTDFALKVADGAFSGIRTTEGADIFLYNGVGPEAGLILGRVGGDTSAVVGGDTPDAGGVVAFALAVDPSTGKVFVAEYLSLEHTNTASADEQVQIISTALQMEVTLTDGDDDTSKTSVDVGQLIHFEDDANVAVNDINSIGLAGTVELIDSFEGRKQSEYSQVGNFNVNNSFGATDGSSVGELQLTGDATARSGGSYSDNSAFSNFFKDSGATTLSGILNTVNGGFPFSDGSAIDTTQIFDGSAFESMPKQVSAGGSISFDWSFRTRESPNTQNDFSFWTLYKVTNTTIDPVTGHLNPGGTYTFVDGGLIMDVKGLYSNDNTTLGSNPSYVRYDPNGNGVADAGESLANQFLTGWEFGLIYDSNGNAVWNNTVADNKLTQQAQLPGQSFADTGDVDPLDTSYLIPVASDGIYVVRFGLVNYGDSADTSQLNIDRIRVQVQVDFDTTGNVLTGATDDVPSLGGPDTLSVDGTRVAQVEFDSNNNGVIDAGETHVIPNGGSTAFAGRYGAFTLDSDGDYTYDANSNTNTQLAIDFPGQTVTVYDEGFRYTAVDGDGDQSTALLTVRIDATGDRSQPDVYIGSMFNDVFDAGAGNDILFGREGADRLTGGAGQDGFSYNKPGEGGDTITDFSAVDDSIRVKSGAGAFTGLSAGTGAINAAEFQATADAQNDVVGAGVRFVFHDGTGTPADPSTLYYDSDGGTSANRILLAVIENGATLTNADVIKF